MIGGPQCHKPIQLPAPPRFIAVARNLECNFQQHRLNRFQHDPGNTIRLSNKIRQINYTRHCQLPPCRANPRDQPCRFRQRGHAGMGSLLLRAMSVDLFGQLANFVAQLGREAGVCSVERESF